MRRKYIMFSIDKEKYAISIKEVKEIVELDTMVKTSEPELNVIVWDGLSIPVIDPIAIMDLESHSPSISSRVIVIEKQSKTFGLLVENVKGVCELDDKDIKEPSLTEPRYVAAVSNGVRLFDPSAILNNRMINCFKRIYQFDLSYLENGEKVRGKYAYGQNQLIESTRLETLNWMIQATKRGIDESFIDKAVDIHNRISQIRG